jgi:hypothetical protein
VRPEDDYTHPTGPEPNFNESMYIHFHDPRSRIGGFLRLANRPNEGRGERTVCRYLPDGRLAFAFAPTRGHLERLVRRRRAAVHVQDPFRRLEVSYNGTVAVLGDPTAMDDPKTALAGAEQTDCSIRLTITATAPAFDHSFDTDEGSFAPKHYEQLLRADGEVRLDGVSISVRGHGLRDHSWDPRYWQTPWFYRWLHGSGDGFGFMGAWFGRPDGSAVFGGFVYDGRIVHEVEHLAIGTKRDDRDERVAVSAVLRAGSLEWKLSGEVAAKVPLRNRRDDGTGVLSVTRIVEGLMTWTLEDGRVVHGMSEYLDQIVDGRPVGLAV